MWTLFRKTGLDEICVEMHLNTVKCICNISYECGQLCQMIKNDFPTLFNALAFFQRCWCFHRSWFGVEKSVVQISWFLVLFWRWEVKMHLLKNDVFLCVFIWLHGNICVLWHIRKYFCVNVAVLQWTVAFCNKDNFSIQEKH